MSKKVRSFFLIMVLSLLFIPSFTVHAAEQKEVHNQSELKEALQDENVSTIILANDIETTEKINIMRPVTIDGANHTIRYVGTFGSSNSTDNTVWGGIYVLQVYKTTATIRNIKLTGGNAALLINGSTVKLEGTIDVSGNGFGGIEIAQGSGVTETPKLILDNNSNLINTTEDSNKPTLWVPENTKEVILEIGNLTFTLTAGEELTLTEINNLATSADSPETGDSTDFILSFLTLILIAFALIIRKRTRKKLPNS